MDSLMPPFGGGSPGCQPTRKGASRAIVHPPGAQLRPPATHREGAHVFEIPRGEGQQIDGRSLRPRTTAPSTPCGSSWMTPQCVYTEELFDRGNDDAIRAVEPSGNGEF
jgi:hypothetical protein